MSGIARRHGLAAFAALLFLAARAPAAPPQQPAVPRTQARFALAQELADFDPLQAWSTPHQVLQRQVYEGLVEYLPGAGGAVAIGPLLAESWSGSADGLEWSFRLREDATFYDPFPEPLWPERRRAVLASDVVASFLALADGRRAAAGWFVLEGLIDGLDAFRAATLRPDTDSARAVAEALAGGLPGLRADGPRELRLRLVRPAPDLLLRLASPYCAVTPPEASARADRSLRDHPVGSGPYHLAEWLPRHRALFRRVPDWRAEADAHGPLPRIDELSFVAVPEGSTRTLMFENGEIDRLPPVQDSFARLIDGAQPCAELRERGVRLAITDTPELSMLVFQLDDPVVGILPGDEDGNARRRLLRRAIALAFPYERWQRVIRNGVWAQPARGFLPPSLPEAAAVPACHWRRADPAEARRLLAEAGWPHGEGLPELRFELLGGDQGTLDSAALLGAALAEIGLRVRAVPNSDAEFRAKIAAGGAQLYLWSWILDWPDAANLLEIFYGPNGHGGVNGSNFDSPDFDRAFLRFRALAPGAERDELARALGAVLAHEMPVVPIDHRRGYLLIQPWLQRVEISSFDLFPCKRFVLEERG